MHKQNEFDGRGFFNAFCTYEIPIWEVQASEAGSGYQPFHVIISNKDLHPFDRDHPSTRPSVWECSGVFLAELLPAWEKHFSRLGRTVVMRARRWTRDGRGPWVYTGGKP